MAYPSGNSSCTVPSAIASKYARCNKRPVSEHGRSGQILGIGWPSFGHPRWNGAWIVRVAGKRQRRQVKLIACVQPSHPQASCVHRTDAIPSRHLVSRLRGCPVLPHRAVVFNQRANVVELRVGNGCRRSAASRLSHRGRQRQKKSGEGNSNSNHENANHRSTMNFATRVWSEKCTTMT